MNQQDIIYLQRVLNAFIEAAIQRVAHSGDMTHRYRLTAEEVRQSTGRQRLHDSVLDDIQDFFHNSNVGITYDRNFGTFDINLDLNRCALNHAQAIFLSTAMTAFRTEHC